MTRELILRRYVRGNIIPFVAFLIALIAAVGWAETLGPIQLSEDVRVFFVPKAVPLSTAQQNPLIDSPLPVNFSPPVTYDSGGELTRWAAVADVNGDDKLDLVVANEQTNTIGVLLGNSDGTFQPVSIYASGGSDTWSVVVADLNGDGKQDLAVANGNAGAGVGTVGVLLGNGDGTFRNVVNYEAAGFLSNAVAIGDLNGDGKPDLVVADGASGSVGVLSGKGNGTFNSVVTYPGGGSLTSVLTADVNGDGKADLVVGSSNQVFNDHSVTLFGTVGILLGNGNGTFQPVVIYRSGGHLRVVENGGGGGGPFVSVAVADLNGDGKLDLLASNGLGCFNATCKNFPAGVLLGNGDGTFQPAVTHASGVFGATAAAIGDVNQDGRPDLLVEGNKVAVLLGNGDGTFQSATTFRTGGRGAGSIAIADVNGDGRPDLLAANVQINQTSFEGSVGVLLNTRVATKTVVTTSVSPSQFGQPVTFTATVKRFRGTVPDGELVMFFDGKTEVGTAVTANGIATFTTSSLTAGTHTVKATYAGDATFKPSSGKVTQVVTP